ncbi:MAG: class I SAM-dependent rRNA methyltransferase [Firmicutes bacterium]|nr:class I SAM-dependent rRNA methyltransferase [Bacillota bacterium]
MAVVQLKKGMHHRIASGHPWLYRTEILEVNGQFRPGDVVDVVDFRGKPLGRGYINPKSQITVRMLTWREESVDEAFFRRRIEAALDYRRRVLPGERSYRLVFGEADFIPGLIVDKFEEYLVIQTLALGIDRWKDTVVDILRDLLSPRGIYERNDAPVRELEGLDSRAGFIGEPFNPTIRIEENALSFLVDVEKGQKTGHFLDQRANRLVVMRLASGRRVLDCFCYTGGFSVHAAAGGALSVEGIDASEWAAGMARENASLNGVSGRCAFVAGNVFDELRGREHRRERYDMIVLDPPAFAKSRGALEGAVRGYKEINLRAMKLLNPGGILVTCSCSRHLTEDLLIDVVRDASADAGRPVRIVEKRTQASDHPFLVAAPESYYLKCLVLQVM